MIKVLCCVFDSAAGAYMEPFVVATIEMALREFRRAVNKEGSPFHEFPADYTLFKCGTFNMETGTLTAENPISLGVAVEFIENPNTRDVDQMIAQSEGSI